MDRKRRIRVVQVAVLGFVSLVVSILIAPIMAVIFFPPITANIPFNELQDMQGRFIQAEQYAQYVSFAAAFVAFACLIYLLVVLAIWFIGPKEMPEKAECPGQA